MILLRSLVTLLTLSTSEALHFTPITASQQSSNHTLTFDALTPPSAKQPIYSPPSPYNHLIFTGLSVFDPKAPPLQYIIVPADHNCAVSKPNALLGSRKGGDGGEKAWFGLAEGGEASSAHGVSTDRPSSFDLLGLEIKPMAAPPGEEQIRLSIRGWKASDKSNRQDVGDGGSVFWYVDFPVGYDLPLKATMDEEFKGLKKVELWADYGPQGLDWEFCLDNLRVSLHKDKGKDEFGSGKWDGSQIFEL